MIRERTAGSEAGTALRWHGHDVSRIEAQGTGPFGDDSHVMQYYGVPAELLEDPEQLRPWIDKALAVARRKKRK